MVTSKEFVRVFDTLVKTYPGMNESIKIGLHMQRKDVVLLTELFERALASPELSTLISEDTKVTLRSTIDELLTKAKLKEFVSGLKEFLGSK